MIWFSLDLLHKAENCNFKKQTLLNNPIPGDKFGNPLSMSVVALVLPKKRFCFAPCPEKN